MREHTARSNMPGFLASLMSLPSATLAYAYNYNCTRVSI
jgi:hypothetical protein